MREEEAEQRKVEKMISYIAFFLFPFFHNPPKNPGPIFFITSPKKGKPFFG